MAGVDSELVFALTPKSQWVLMIRSRDEVNVWFSEALSG